ncbi:MAG TPA: ComEC/Rec2 family competence protein [Bacillota bacterium]|nr:ComEC/Rec2 family competence protein [Bacillota bacterium]
MLFPVFSIRTKQFYGKFFQALLMVGLAVSVLITVYAAPNKNGLRIHFIDVGQADSILIQTPQGKNMLVDAGNNDDGTVVVNYLNRLGVKQLEAVVGTHPHEDHIGGLDEVILKLPVKAVYLPKVTATTKTFEDLLLAIKTKRLKVTTARAGVKVALDSGVKAEFLAPNSEKYDEANEYSAVLKLTYGKTSFLLAGDAEKVSEREMLEKGYDLHANLLKVGHHGSGGATKAKFLEAVAPQYAVICVGKNNDYKHPHAQTLNRLKKLNVQVYRTDQLGTIVVTSDGKKLSLKHL